MGEDQDVFWRGLFDAKEERTNNLLQISGLEVLHEQREFFLWDYLGFH